MPAPLYARYVPPTPATTSSPVSAVRRKPQATPVVGESPANPTPEKSTKRRRTIEQPYPVLDPEDTSIQARKETTIAPAEPKKEKKERKERDKKRKREPKEEAQEQEGNDGSTLKKHKSVLSKFEKSAKVAEAIRKNPVPEKEEEAETKEELHDLVPLPQPEPVPDAPYEPTFSDLPPWLAQPTTIPSDKQIPFRELGIDDRFVNKLEKKGHHNALAVQSQIIPMLRPGLAQHLGDLCVLAKTGSGKTLAYLLPMIESMRDRTVTKLSVVVVVPTRLLVNQVYRVAEELCHGTRLKVAATVGDVPLPIERKMLVKLSGRYNPARAKELRDKAEEQLKTGFVKRGGPLDDLMTMLPDHIPYYESNVDILICTPGRLVEHLESTTGFLLRDVQWVVFDEADQLLDQSFQEWANVLMHALHSETPPNFMNARERLCKSKGWPVPRKLTKVLLSATITKDLTKLAALRLIRPKLVAVQDEAPDLQANGEAFELPSTLKEFAVPVGDGSDKPLYLLRLLQTKLLPEVAKTQQNSSDTEMDSDSDASTSEAESDSDSGSDSDSDESSSSSSSSSDSDSDSDSKEEASKPVTKSSKGSSPKSVKDQLAIKRVLIFTKSNENAARLSHFLSSMCPPLKDIMGALTKASTKSASKKLLDSFRQGKIQILISSDRASRGLDIPNLTHVVNYDIPHNVTSYVHRVGRTARAEKEGQAWTLFTLTEARWFWNEIARGSSIRRGGRKVERVEPDVEAVTAERKEAYQAALGALQVAVEGDTKRAKKA